MTLSNRRSEKMRNPKSIFSSTIVLVVTLIAGGWFIQSGVGQSAKVYVQSRLVQEVIEHVSEQFVDPVDRSSLIESAIQGVLEDLNDTHTSFIDADTWDNFRLRSGADAEYGGVGLEILKRDGWVTVITPLPDGPAIRAGIRAGDQIVEVEGDSAEGWDTDRTADRLRGKPGTKVDIMIRRPGIDDVIPFELTRDVIELLSVPFSLMLDAGVGYIPLQVFNKNSGREMRKAIENLQNQGMSSLILDLRDNPGGLLEEGVAIADMFLPNSSAILETRGRTSDHNEKYTAVGPELLPDIPVVVMVNQNSASSSEIVAGALQDHDRALVIGVRSYGKGSVQTLYPLTGGNILRLTTAKWYTPVGRSIDINHENQVELQAQDSSMATLTFRGQRVLKEGPEEQSTFRSTGGRILYGDGGITPDVIVLPDTLTIDEQVVVRKVFRSAGVFSTALFNFSVSYVQDHPELEVGFSLSVSDMDHFYSYLLKNYEVDLDLIDFTTASRFVKYQLEREVALQAWEREDAFRQIKDKDVQLNKAIDLLRVAKSPKDLFLVHDDPQGVYGDNVVITKKPEISDSN